MHTKKKVVNIQRSKPQLVVCDLVSRWSKLPAVTDLEICFLVAVSMF